MDIVTTYGCELLRSSLSAIQHVVDSDLDLSLVPSFHVILGLLPLCALVQSGKLHPEAQNVIDRENIADRYRHLMARVHPEIALMIRDLDSTSPPLDYADYAFIRSDGVSEAPHEQLSTVI